MKNKKVGLIVIIGAAILSGFLTYKYVGAEEIEAAAPVVDTVEEVVVEKSPQEIFRENLQKNINGLSCGKQSADVLGISAVNKPDKADQLTVLSTKNVGLPLKDVIVSVSSPYELQLLGIKCPDPNKVSTKTAGLEAVAFAKDWVESRDGDLVALSFGQDKHNRVLSHVCDATTGDCLNNALLASGHAKAYCPKNR